MRRSLIAYLLGFLFIVISEFQVFAQNLNELYNFIDSKQKKSVEKAFKQISEAGKLTQESSKYYNEVLSLQNNFELDEKTLQKKLKKSEQEALSLQLKADKLYSSAYKSLYEICQKVLTNDGSTDDKKIVDLKKMAEEMMQSAENNRAEAKNEKNINTKALLSNDAVGYEASAIDYLLSAIKIQNGMVLAEPTHMYTEEPPGVQNIGEEESQVYKLSGDNYSQSIQQKSENIAIDMKVVNKYGDYVNDNSIPDPLMINRSGVKGTDDVSVNNARNIIYNYRYGNDYTFSEQPTSSMEIQPSQKDSTSLALSVNQNESENQLKSESQYESENQIEEEKITSASVLPTSDLKSDSRTAFDLSATPQSSDIIFKVQIAASRIPMTRAQLWAIYPGNYTVEVDQEEGWYKYRIGGFRLFSDAYRVVTESGVDEAWVVSYRQGKQIDLVQARDMTRVMETETRRYGDKAIKNPVDYYVQVVASKTRLNDDVVKKLSGSAGICREIIEEGWFKYQIYTGNEYEQALKIKNQITGDSFIVAYERGSKINLRKAINKNN